MFIYIKQYLGNVCEKVNLDVHNTFQVLFLLSLVFKFQKGTKTFDSILELIDIMQREEHRSFLAAQGHS